MIDLTLQDKFFKFINLGLFMGASFLSFAEVIEMLINLVRVAFRYNKLKQKIIQNHNS